MVCSWHGGCAFASERKGSFLIWRNTIMQKARHIILAIVPLIAFGLVSAVEVAAQRGVAVKASVQQPLITEYRGITLGMPAAEAAAKLGTPAQSAADQDFFILSEKETIQIVYDANRRVTTISIDFFDGLGAPDYRDVVGNEITTKPDGALYKLVRYPSHGFWVSYSRTAGPAVIVSITIQKI
jgi:hypothetical protein